ncbi:PD-(D/E)XK nuclease-like domain-containing protein [Pandoraea apista]|uniref:PD-(D/E)XK nuclease-like domain-containing protein n=1 Tax=Pandoraea apista TaxID=93218 RepID=UPI00065A6CD4|nr:PD-(D/E)XK nuclease-like domain-containing protein [Pandoraea apista]ALS63597.1 hypothetical protein AT395_00055 [Pandoraea apista]CFB63123.1 Exodeoxyribonuclease 8 [Pandoraea apista]
MSQDSALVVGMPIDQYHADTESISKTGLDLIARAPAIYYARMLDPQYERVAEKLGEDCEETKPGQLEGTLAHCAILEPDEFGKRYAIGPAVRRNTKEWKAFEEKARADGKIAIKGTQYNTAMYQADSAHRHPRVNEILSGFYQVEVSAYWTDPQTGVRCRCRPDVAKQIDATSSVLMDVKTFSSADANEFSRQAARKRYHVQDPFYTQGYEIASGTNVEDFLFCVIETEWPFAVQVFSLDDESRTEGYNEVHRNLDVYERCLRTGVWPGYGTEVTKIRLPAYALTYEEVEISYAE